MYAGHFLAANNEKKSFKNGLKPGLGVTTASGKATKVVSNRSPGLNTMGMFTELACYLENTEINAGRQDDDNILTHIFLKKITLLLKC